MICWMTTLDHLEGHQNGQKWSEVVQNDHKAHLRLITIKLYIVRSYFVSLFHIKHNCILMATHVTTRVVASGHRWPQSKVSTYYYEVAYCSISFWELVYFVSLLTVYDHPCDHKSGQIWPQIKVPSYNYEVTYCSISFWKLIHFVWLLVIVTTQVTTGMVISVHKIQDKARAIINNFIIN